MNDFLFYLPHNLSDEATPVTGWFDLRTVVQSQTHLFSDVFVDDS